MINRTTIWRPLVHVWSCHAAIPIKTSNMFRPRDISNARPLPTKDQPRNKRKIKAEERLRRRKRQPSDNSRSSKQTIRHLLTIPTVKVPSQKCKMLPKKNKRWTWNSVCQLPYQLTPPISVSTHPRKYVLSSFCSFIVCSRHSHKTPPPSY